MRDLAADLELCNRATPGPWTAVTGKFPKVNSSAATLFAAIYASEADAQFVAAAREGWPEAIRRAMAAEQGMEELHARLVADELEALDFVWQEYVQADPATLTEDAKELAERVRQKVRELAGVERLEAERDAVKARLAEVEAEAARMRKALTPFADAGTIAAAIGLGGGVLIGTIGNDAYELYVYHLYWARDALVSCSTGREAAERLRLLEELAEAATEFTEHCTLGECHSRRGEPICDEDPCPMERVRTIVRELKGDQSDAGAAIRKAGRAGQ